MNRRDAREIVYTGKLTYGDLRRCLAAFNPESWRRSKVNSMFSAREAADIFMRGIADISDGTRVDPSSSRHVLTATNIIRECGVTVLLLGKTP